MEKSADSTSIDGPPPRPSSFIVDPSSLSITVTADDFGIGYATSQGIVDAHLRGPVTSTSVMTVTGDHLRRSVPLLAEAPNLETGLHVVLTRCGEKPLLARESSGLVDRDGEFFSNSKLWLRALAGKLAKNGAADEIAAQTDRFHKELGRAPAYVDSHHHAHQLPIIRDALLDVIGHDLLPAVARVTVEPPGMLRRVGAVRFKRLAAHLMGRRARRALHDKWVWTNDSYIGMLAPHDLKRPFPWAPALANLPTSGNIEWIVHPGREDPSLQQRDSYTLQRVVELNALTSDSTHRFWHPLKPILAPKSQVRKRPTV